MVRNILRTVTVVITLAALPASAQQPSDARAQLNFLLGEWTGGTLAADSPGGTGQGDYSFKAELGGNIIVRRNSANLTSGERHDDLMVIFFDGPGRTPHAMYWDSEGHTIRYSAAFPAPGKVVFESDPAEAGPRYRLSYSRQGSALDGKFEIAPPGGKFAAYLNWPSKLR